MAVLLITYDLRKPGKNYEGLLGAIKSNAWAKLSESSYAIKIENSPQTVFDNLKHFIDDNDQLYVITLKRPYAGQGSTEVDAWLDRNLPH